MNEATKSEAPVEKQDITVALTPGQLVLLAIGVWLLLRAIRSLRR